MEQDIRLNLNCKYSNIISLYNLLSNVKESIVNNNMKYILDTDVFASDDEYEGNNIPNYNFSTNISLKYFSKLKQLNSHIQSLFRNGLY